MKSCFQEPTTPNRLPLDDNGVAGVTNLDDPRPTVCSIEGRRYVQTARRLIMESLESVINRM